MNKEQYEAAHTILGFCRIFCDQMVKCMKNSGLDKLGYHLNIDFDPTKYEDGKVSLGRIGIEKNISEYGSGWWTEAFIQRHMEDEGWVIGHDPYAESGISPENIRFPEDRDERTGMAKKTEHPYPPDGLWISVYDYPPYVDGGK